MANALELRCHVKGLVVEPTNNGSYLAETKEICVIEEEICDGFAHCDDGSGEMSTEECSKKLFIALDKLVTFYKFYVSNTF